MPLSDEMKRLRVIVAESGDRAAMDSFNAAARAMRGDDAADSTNGYQLINDAKMPPASNEGVGLQNQISMARDFEAMCKRFHRKNPSEVL